MFPRVLGALVFCLALTPALPAQVAMLLKTLVTLEGTTRLLSPQFSN